eukprot:jgi/Phyca11/129955/e_gw1.89.110.1
MVCKTKAICFRPSEDYYLLEVSEKDVETLQPEGWLNETVVSYFIREHIDASSSVYNFDGQLFGSILMSYRSNSSRMTQTYPMVCGLTARFPYEKYRTIVVPRVARILGGFFKQEALKKYNVKNVPYAIKSVKTSPLQKNSFDCGVFMLYSMREVNRALVRTPNMLLLLNIGNICSAQKPAL